MASALLAALDAKLDARRTAGLDRRRIAIESPQGPRVKVGGRELIAFASNDYLGLANDPRVVAAARDAATRWGVGAGASHLICGHFAPHEALENELAAFVAPCADARALTFSTGYLANLAILSALAGRNDAIFADRLNHACLNDGALLARAEFVRYPHGDVAALAQRLATSTAACRIIATDAVFSMDGDLAPLQRLLELADAHDAWLVVDDAHGFGVLGDGRGSVAHAGLSSERIIYMGTLGKAAGVAGAFVAAHASVVETLVQSARPYIYTTAAPPLLAAALRVALAIISDDAGRRAHLSRLIARFREGARDLPWKLLASDHSDPAAGRRRQRRRDGRCRRVARTRLLGSGDPAADRSAGHGAAARVVVIRAHGRRRGGAARGAARERGNRMSALAVEVTGHGPPVVLLHGWAMHSGVWGPLVAKLARHHRVIAVDLPGHGHSAPISPCTLEAMAAAVDGALAAETQPLAVLGWSLGGLVAMRWALARPARVQRLALVCTTPRFIASPDWPHADVRGNAGGVSAMNCTSHGS